MLTEETIKEWRSHPTTEEVFEYLQEEIDRHIAVLVGGGTIGETADATAQETAKIQGIIRGLTAIFEIEGE